MEITSLQGAAQMAPATAAPADQLEQAFLEEMLKYCGPKPMQNGFSGGAGEEQFSSFLTTEYAGILARKLDLGLSIGGAA